MQRLITAPTAYVAWAVIVMITLVGTYPVDPYLYGFTTLGLAWLTGVVALVAIGACFLRDAPSTAGKLVMFASVIIAAAAVAQALHVLGGFNWA